MAEIVFDSVSVDLPVFNANGRSLTSNIVRVATGGRLDSDPNGRVVVRALEDISFSYQDGDRIALLGHNGAGKSTLLRTISGVYAPLSGTVSVQGNVSSLIGISLGISPEATGRENIFLRSALMGIPKSEVKARFQEIVDFAGLGNFIEMPVRTYSSGMQLRLAFAVSTVVQPEILIMDEWLSVGDEGFKQKAEERLSQLVGSTKILVLASHSQKLIEKTCNKAMWLEHGKVRLAGSAQEVCQEYFNQNSGAASSL